MTIANELRSRTLNYASDILTFCRSLPDTWDARELGKQLLRAGMGTAGNYWSACRGRSHREFVAKLGTSVDECDESVLWLMLMERAKVGDQNSVGNLQREGQETRAILSKSHRTARENRQRREGGQRSQFPNPPTRPLTKSSEGLP